MADFSLPVGATEVGAEPPLAGEPQGASLVVEPSHPVASEEGNSFWTNLKRAAATAGINTLSTLSGASGVDPSVSPLFGGQSLSPDVRAQMTPAATRENLFKETGATEFQPQGTPWKMGAGMLNAGANQLAMPIGGVAKTLLPAMAGGAGAEGIRALFPNMNPAMADALGFTAGSMGAGAAGNLAARAATGPTRSVLSAIPKEEAELAQKGMTAPYPMQPTPAKLSNSPASNLLWSMTSKMPFSGAGELNTANQRALNQNFATEMGATNPPQRLSQEFFENTRKTLGAGFNDITARNNITGTQIPPLLDDMQKAVTNARLNLGNDDFETIKRNADNIIASFKGDTMPGSIYQNLTEYKSPLSNLQFGGGKVSVYAGQLRDALDNALQRSMADPADMQRFQQLRQQWKAMLTIEPLTLRADVPGGPSASLGDINPALARSAVRTMYPASGHAQSNMDTYARFAEHFLKDNAGPTTAERLNLSSLLHGGGMAALGFGGAEGAGASLPLALAGGIGTLGVNRMVNAALRNPTIANQMVQSSLNPGRFRFGYLPGMGVPQMPFALSPLTDQDRIQPPQ